MSYCSSVLEFLESLKGKSNVKVRQNHGDRVENDSSDSISSALDASQSVFCGSNVQEVVKMIKSAAEPLIQLVADAEEELAKGSSSADSSSTDQKQEMLASQLKAQYIKSLHALSAIKQSKRQAKVNNCTDETDAVEHDDNTSDFAAGANSELKKVEDCSSSQSTNAVNNSKRASRADIEAQRDLHKEMLSSKNESSESDGDSSETSKSSEEAEGSSSEESDDDDEYDPKKEIRQVKLERGHERRETRKKQNIRAGN